MSFRVAFLATLVSALAWFQFGQASSAADLGRQTADLLDPRPARSILIVGNSRTYTNDMPRMLREIADSAGSPTKFQVETSTPGAYTFKRHYKDRRTRRMLTAGWDDVVLQAESGAQMYPQGNSDFLKFGPKLAGIAKLNGARPRLLVGWPYDRKLYGDPAYNPWGLSRSDHVALIKSAHAQLAQKRRLELDRSRGSVGASPEIASFHPSYV